MVVRGSLTVLEPGNLEVQAAVRERVVRYRGVRRLNPAEIAIRVRELSYKLYKRHTFNLLDLP